MRKKDKVIIYISVLIVSLALFLVYLYGRTGQIHSINDQIAKIRTENLSRAGEMSERENAGNMFPAKAGIAEFVEALFDAARVSGLTKHEVSTVKTGEAAERKNVVKGKAGESAKDLKIYSLKISLEGNYRDTVEYIREVQNIGRYKRVMEIGMKPADKILRTNLTVEIVSLGGQDAEQ